jgi:hypothetical protein
LEELREHRYDRGRELRELWKEALEWVDSEPYVASPVLATFFSDLS